MSSASRRSVEVLGGAGRQRGSVASDKPETDDLDHLFGRPAKRKASGVAAQGQVAGAENSGLGELRRQFEDAGRDARRIAEGLSTAQINWRSSVDRWSIAECLGHLNIFGSEMLPVIDEVIAEARSRRRYATGPFRAGFLGRRLLTATEPPVRRRRRALAHHLPQRDQDAKDALSALVDLNAHLASRVQSATGLDLARIRIAIPTVKFFRLNLFELFLFIAAHERRHLAQARAVRENPLFPRVPEGPEAGRSSVLARPFR